MATSVTVGGSVSGAIDFAGDADFYSVNLTAGQTYFFSLRGTGADADQRRVPRCFSTPVETFDRRRR